MTSLSVKEKKDFVILTPADVVAFMLLETPSNVLALVPLETTAKPKFVIETTAAQGMTRYERCYTPKELALGDKKKDQGKNPISEGKAEEF